MSKHVVQFYGSNHSALLRHLRRYVAQGLDAGDYVVVIANRALHDAVFAVNEITEDGRLELLDSEVALKQLFENGRLNPNRFDQFIGGMLRGVVASARSHRVRAYGDMVDVLWRRGRHADAIELERYWNDLQERLPFDLYCAYGIDVFSTDFQAGKISPVLCEHTDVVPGGREELRSALDYATYETLGYTCPPLPHPEATILWLRTSAPEHAAEILERARRYVND